MKFFLPFLFLIPLMTKAEVDSDDYSGIPYTPIQWRTTLSAEGLLLTTFGIPDGCRPLIEEYDFRRNRFEDAELTALRGHQSESPVWRDLKYLRQTLYKVELDHPKCFSSLALYAALSAAGSLQDSNAFLFLAFLAKEGKLVALSRTDREKLGGIWNQKFEQDSDRALVMGAYDCETSTVYFDPYLPPGDLAASLAHELSHLLRDKMISSNLSLRENLLADETLASFKAAYLQLSQHDRYLVSYGPKNDKNANFDFTMYSREGALRKMGPEFGIELRTNMTMNQFLDFYSAKNWAVKNIENSFSVVQKQYFTDRVLDSAKLFQKIQKQGRMFKDPLEMIPKVDLAKLGNRYFRPGDLYEIFERKTKVLDDTFIDFAERTKTALGKPSGQCKAFLEKTSKGELKDYLGSGLRTPMKPGSEGVKPGSEGVKPGTGVRLCISQRIRI